MIKVYNTKKRIVWLITLLTLGILRGVAFGANPPEKDEADPIGEVQGKTVLQILEIANKYSFTNLKLSLAYAHIALTQAIKSGNNRDIFDAKRAIGFIYEDNAMPQRAIETYESDLKTAEILGDSALTTIYTDLAVVSRKVGNVRNSYNYYEKTLAIAMAQKPRDEQIISDAYHGLGNLHLEIGVYDKAIRFYLQSLEVSEMMKNRVDIIVSHIDIAEAYLKAKEIDKALEHIEKAYQMALENKKNKPTGGDSDAQLASAMNKYGQILSDKGDYKGALVKLREALAVYESFNHKPYVARTLMAIGNVYLQQNLFAEAEKKYNECLKMEVNLYDKDLTELHFRMGLLFQKRNQNAAAEQSFSKSLMIANKNDFKEFAQKANYQMFLLCLERHENKKALDYLNISTALNDSLFNTAKARRTAEMELKFDSEKRENQIHSLQARENQLFLFSSIIVFIMIVLFLGYTIRMRGRNVRNLQVKNEEIQQQFRKLEESNEILSQFAHVAAHDLKEPLRSIGSYIGLIQMRYGKDMPQDARDYMQFVNAGVKRMYSLLTDLLDFSQVISQQPGCEVIRPDEILGDVRDNLRSAIEAKNAQILYSQNLPSIRMNRLHLTQLFQNLIGNALKFTEGAPIVKVEAREENGNIILTIEDNGIGIRKEYGSKVFVLFQQLNKKGDFEGTGIGLTICKNIVEKYNGKIWFDSEENKGTKFYISIPAQAA